MKNFCIVLLIAILAGACTSTSIVSSWKEPGATYTKEEFKKVMVVALLRDETTRRIAEDKMATFDSTFVQSYRVPGHEKLDSNEVEANNWLLSQHFDGVITLRLNDVQKQLNYVPGTYYGGYYGWYGNYYGGWGSPGYYEEDNNYIMETNVFSVRQNKLLWSGITSTVDPTSLYKTIDEVETEVIAQMRRDGFIVGQPKKK